MPYTTLKHNLKTKYDFLIFFENRTGNITTINGTTYLGITKDEPLITKNNVKTKTNLKNMLAVKRYLILDSEIITMVTYIWN